MIFKLFKILFSNMYSFGSFIEDFKKNKKSAAKNIFFILLFAFLFISIGRFYAQVMNIMYTAFSVTGNPELMPVSGLLFTCIIMLFFGFCTIASSYYAGSSEDQFLTLPLKKYEIFGAKFTLTLFNESLIGLVIMFICAFVYGKNEHLLSNPFFYIGTIIMAFAVCLVIVTVIYVILIGLLLIFPILRKRSLLTVIASICIILFSGTYGMISSSLGNPNSTFNQIETYYALTDSIRGLCAKIPFIPFLAGSISGKILPCFVLIGICAILIFVIIPVLSAGYIKSLEGFSDEKAKKLSAAQTKKVFSDEIKIHSIVKTLYLRDLRILWREPSFFANGPLLVFIFPAIMIVAFSFGMFSTGGSGTMDALFEDLRTIFDNFDKSQMNSASYYIALVLSGFTVFIGNSNNIAATSFSREGKDMLNLKAMPIKAEEIAKAKFFHALSYVVLEFVIMILLLTVLFIKIGLPVGVLVKSIYLSFFLCGSISVFLIFVDMFIDTARPKLNWENPNAAFKNNLNSLLSVLASLVVVILFVLLGFFFPKSEITIEIIAFVFIILASMLGVMYYKYAAKKIPAMLC